MTFLMLLGATCFSIFIIFCVENMHIFDMSKKKQITYAWLGLMIVIIVILAREFGGISGWAVPLLAIFLMIILWIIVYRNFLKILMLTVYLTALYFGIEAMYALTCVLIGRTPAAFHEYSEHLDIGILAICWVTVLVAALVLKKILKKRIDMNILNHRAMYFMVISAGISLLFIYLKFILGGVLFTLGQQTVNFGDIAYLLFFASSIMMFVIILRYIAKETTQRTEKLLIESSKKYINDLEESYQALRTIKHDYVNILTSLKLHIDSGDMESLEKYYYGELSEMNKDLLYQDHLMSSLQNIKISEIKSILIYKGSLALNLLIDTAIEVREAVEKLGVSTAIVCQILGILLDNAIEAAAITDEKKLRIAIINNPNSKVFIIKNTWKQQDFPVSKFFELGFSTKEGNRGVGLYTVRSLTEKINGLFLETEVTAEYFIQKLTVKEN
ncbi:MAG: GHKL domain-containing protein [Lachnospiraceae bacterium]|nr:GHKL domain-containing protein [Lachnospiraceae bacterium]